MTLLKYLTTLLVNSSCIAYAVQYKMLLCFNTDVITLCWKTVSVMQREEDEFQALKRILGAIKGQFRRKSNPVAV